MEAGDWNPERAHAENAAMWRDALAEAENRCSALMIENRDLKRRLAERDASLLKATGRAR